MAKTYCDGLILLGSSNQILDIDSNAKAIIEAGLGLRLIGNRLHSLGRQPGEHNDAMQSFLEGEHDNETLFIIRSGSNCFITLHRYAAEASSSPAKLGTSHVVRLAVIDLSLPPNTALLATIFGLTRSEEAIITALTASSNASEAARSINLSRETVKSHLTSMYAKTGTSSLAQLMLLAGKLVYRA